MKNGAPTASSAPTALNRLGEYTDGGDKIAVARNRGVHSGIPGAPTHSGVSHKVQESEISNQESSGRAPTEIRNLARCSIGRDAIAVPQNSGIPEGIQQLETA